MRSAFLLGLAMLCGCGTQEAQVDEAGGDAVPARVGPGDPLSGLCGPSEPSTRPVSPTDLKQAKLSMKQLEGAIKLYRLDINELPKRLADLVEEPAELPQGARWLGYYPQELPRDPWDHDFIYEPLAEGDGFTLRSAGRDGKAGTDDDIIAISKD